MLIFPLKEKRRRAAVTSRAPRVIFPLGDWNALANPSLSADLRDLATVLELFNWLLHYQVFFMREKGYCPQLIRLSWSGKRVERLSRVSPAKRLHLSLNPLWTLAKSPTKRNGEKGDYFRGAHRLCWVQKPRWAPAVGPFLPHGLLATRTWG